MDDLVTRAQLVGYDPAHAAIGTVVARAEFTETAARGEFPATLLLDLVEAGAGDEAAHARIAVDWDKDTLEQLLASTQDEEIALWFDERELARAFDDVEAHGLRERAAVLAIAVTAAAASATPALARTVPPMGAERGEQLNQQISPGKTQSTPGAAVQSMGTQRGEQLNQQVSAGQTQSPSAEAPGVTSTGGSDLSTGELAAVLGAGAILISAAGFGIARKHTPPVSPA